MELIEVLQPQTPRRAEKRFLNKHPYNAFLTIKRNAYDQYSAAEAARQLIDVNSSFYRLFDHAYRYSIDGAKCGVYGNGDFYLVEREISGVSHTKTPSNKQLEESMGELERAIKYIGTKNNANDFSALIHAALFHAQSLDSKSSENQLLDMWAIIERP